MHTIGLAAIQLVKFSDMKCDILELRRDNYKVWNQGENYSSFMVNGH